MAEFWGWMNVQFLSRIAKRFKLDDIKRRADAFALIKTIQPITDADVLLRSAKIASKTADISAGTGTTVMFTVPKGKRWIVQLHVKSDTTDPRACQFFDGTTPVNFTVDDANQVISTFSGGIALEEDWVVRSQNTGNAADNNRTDYIMYLEEDAFRA